MGQKNDEEESLGNSFFRYVFEHEKAKLGSSNWKAIQKPKDHYEDLIEQKEKMYEKIVNKYKNKNDVICQKILEAFENHFVQKEGLKKWKEDRLSIVQEVKNISENI